MKNTIKNFVTSLKNYIYNSLNGSRHINHSYRLIDVQYNYKTKSYNLIIHIEYRNASLIKSAAEVAEDDEFISGFSPLDARTIGYLACQEKFTNREKNYV